MSHYIIGLVESTQYNDTDERLFVVTPNATPFEFKRYTPQPGESGTILIRYNACDNTTPLTANRYKLVRYKKKFDGTLTIANVTSLYSNNDTGFSSVDFTVTANNGDIVITVTGTANLVMHTMRTEILSGVLD
jgi:hypothetical protein